MARVSVMLVLLAAVLLSSVEAYKYGDIVPISVSMLANTITGRPMDDSPRVPILHSKCPRFMQLKDIELPVPSSENLFWMKMQLALEDEGFISPFFTFFEKPVNRPFTSEASSKGPMLLAIYVTFVVEGDDIVDVEWDPDYELATAEEMAAERSVLVEFRFRQVAEETGTLGVMVTLLAPLATAMLLLVYIIFSEADNVTGDLIPTSNKAHFSPAAANLPPMAMDGSAVGFSPVSPAPAAAPVSFYSPAGEKTD